MSVKTDIKKVLIAMAKDGGLTIPAPISISDYLERIMQIVEGK